MVPSKTLKDATLVTTPAVWQWKGDLLCCMREGTLVCIPRTAGWPRLVGHYSQQCRSRAWARGRSIGHSGCLSASHSSMGAGDALSPWAVAPRCGIRWLYGPGWPSGCLPTAVAHSRVSPWRVAAHVGRVCDHLGGFPGRLELGLWNGRRPLCGRAMASKISAHDSLASKCNFRGHATPNVCTVSRGACAGKPRGGITCCYMCAMAMPTTRCNKK